MWIGVTSGLALRKFSGSVNILGENRINMENKVSAIVYPKASLIE